MPRLNQNNLTNALGKLAHPKYKFLKQDYDRDLIHPGVVHFGVGNFHRCHQAVYIDKLLGQGYTDMGIVGVSMRSPKVRDALKPQDFLYTTVTLGEQTELKIIGSILNILVAPENCTAVVDQVADPNIKLVTTTITEKGYCLLLGEIDNNHPDVVADKICLKNPRTIYGFIAAAIIQRSKNNGVPLSIVCCDNIQAGGLKLQSGVHMLLLQHANAAIEWANTNVSFASSMVDRVCPATDEALIRLVNSTLGLEDAWPTSGEAFSQWVIEDKFAAPTPAFDTVGVLITDDISLFEQMKLRLLNAGHSVISVLGYLSHHAEVHTALEDPSILEFVQKALHENLMPVTIIPTNYCGEDYIYGIIKRFQNKSLPYLVQQVNSDSSQKIQQRWLPSIDDALAQNTGTEFMSFAIAAWVIYVEKALAAKELNDPLIDDFSEAQKNGTEVLKQFLIIAGADRFKFIHSAPFMATALTHYAMLKNSNINVALNQFLSMRSLQEKETKSA